MKKIIKNIVCTLCAAAIITALPFQIMAKPKKLSKSIEVGDTVYFGKYEQDANKKNGKEKIEWQVLDKKDGKALLISKYILDLKPYNKEYVDITWEDSTIRKWLNKIFIHAAFNEKEKKQICKTNVVNKDNTDKIIVDGVYQFTCNTKGGNTTEDKVFLLSIDEAKQYFDSDEQRSAFITKYAEEKEIRDLYFCYRRHEMTYNDFIESREKNYKGKWWYWLRSPANSQCYASFIEVSGFIANYNVCPDAYGGAGWEYDSPETIVRESGSLVSSKNGIRPVIWVKI